MAMEAGLSAAIMNPDLISEADLMAASSSFISSSCPFFFVNEDLFLSVSKDSSLAMVSSPFSDCFINSKKAKII